MRILVTGGAGFIGSHIVDALITQGHEVIVVDNLTSGRKENINPAARFYFMDICSPEMEEVFRKEKPELVNHHAAQIDVRRSVADPHEDARVNIVGLLNLLKNCVRYGVKGFIFASSGGVVYGEPTELPVKEGYPKGPLSPYGVSKLASEYYLYCFAQVHGLPYITLRYGNVYGPRQDPHGEAGVVAIFGNKMLKGETPTIYGDGEQLRDYVYVQDVVKANLLAMEKLAKKSYPSLGKGIDGLAYNIGTGKGTSVNELFHLLKKVIGYQGEAIYGPTRAGELKRIYLDCSKAWQELGWRAEVKLEEGLKHTVQSLTPEIR
ncbi:UDP-glucose 4-epimerase [Thermanaeromonas toyohensis ToBE]|uniref:UDP-glucose 4-epimerase n=1 Tax=Thermanaeromonas toyohensis ToBE TaxID=698762 RepID=A0A1W1VZC5_9FIRM|nr:NAD-dependent epimerase/dehydratase family protein [Thermanaeromonas toyohensis]SMB98204.1 UDP-glucose 4-epimerase [Thermanaeromonas toyohensis ToBE]